MARIRTLKPEFWTHEGLSALPEATHLLAAALLNYADDYGYFNANVGLIRAACSPLREPSVSIPESLRSLQTIGYLRFGTGPDGRRYGHIVAFEDHQRVSHPTKSKIACLTITWDVHGRPPDYFPNPPESFRPEGNREQGTGKGKEHETRARARDDAIEHAEWLETKALYPPNPARADWIGAERAARQLVERGDVSWIDLREGVTRYAKLCAATGRLVLNPVKFFTDADKPWAQDWPLPDTPERRAAAAREASESIEWTNLEERAERVGFRKRHPHDDLLGYRTLVQRAEADQPRRSQGSPQPVAKLLTG